MRLHSEDGAISSPLVSIVALLVALGVLNTTGAVSQLTAAEQIDGITCGLGDQANDVLVRAAGETPEGVSGDECAVPVGAGPGVAGPGAGGTGQAGEGAGPVGDGSWVVAQAGGQVAGSPVRTCAHGVGQEASGNDGRPWKASVWVEEDNGRLYWKFVTPSGYEPLARRPIEGHAGTEVSRNVFRRSDGKVWVSLTCRLPRAAAASGSSAPNPGDAPPLVDRPFTDAEFLGCGGGTPVPVHCSKHISAGDSQAVPGAPSAAAGGVQASARFDETITYPVPSRANGEIIVSGRTQVRSSNSASGQCPTVVVKHRFTLVGLSGFAVLNIGPVGGGPNVGNPAPGEWSIQMPPQETCSINQSYGNMRFSVNGYVQNIIHDVTISLDYPAGEDKIFNLSNQAPMTTF